MAIWKPRSFRAKLVLLITLTCAVAVALTCALLIGLDYRRMLTNAQAELASDAHVLALNTAATLMFDDPNAAAETLGAFRADPTIAAAYVFRKDGTSFAQYQRPDAKLPPIQARPQGHVLDGNWLIYTEPISHENDHLGSLVLVLDMGEAYQSFQTKTIVAAGVSLAMILLALLVSSRVERTLTRPIADLVDVTSRVSQTQDYSLRIRDPGADEIGRFATVFNDMLARIQSQEVAVRNSERLYRAIGESINYGVWVCAPDGRNIYASDSFLKLVGLTQEQCSSFGWGNVLHPEDKERTIAAWKECVRTQGEWDIEHRFLGVDGKYHPVLARGVLVRDEKGEPIYWVGINLDINNLKRAEESLRQLNETLEQRVAERTEEAEQNAVQLRALAAQLTRAEDRERRRLAAALHDNLQQVLFAAKMRVSIAHVQAGSDPVRGMLDQVTDLLARSIEISRSLTVELSPPILYDAGLAPALHWLSRHMLEKHNLVVRIDANPHTAPLSEEMQAFLFQSARELLFNVVKHAGVREAAVRLDMEGDMVTLVIKDRGCGMDPGKLSQPGQGGFGLFSIRERLRHLGGKCTITTAPGAGVAITLAAPPLTPEQARAAAAARQQAPGGETALAATTPPPRVRVLIADDHQIVRDGLAGLLRSHPRIDVVGVASNGEEAFEQAERHRPDVVIMDVTMPRVNGVEATRRIKAHLPATRVIALSMHNKDDFGPPLLNAGAKSYVSKNNPAEDLIDQILEAAQEA